MTILWDIPEYSGHDDDEDHVLRPVLNVEKQIYVLEMSVPWIEHRKAKFEEKEDKYKTIVQNLKVDNPGYKVTQLTFIMDCLGGCSKNLVTSLKQLKFNAREIENVIFGMQKIVLSEAQAITRQFKILTKR